MYLKENDNTEDGLFVSADWTRFSTYARRIRTLNTRTSGVPGHPSCTFQSLTTILDSLPSNNLFHNLYLLKWTGSKDSLPLSFFFSSNITHFFSVINEVADAYQVTAAMKRYNPRFKELQLLNTTSLSWDKAAQLATTALSCVTRSITVLNWGFEPRSDGVYKKWKYLPISKDALASLPKFPHLRTLYLTLGSSPLYAKKQQWSTSSFIGFPVLSDLAIYWKTSALSYTVIEIVNGITSSTLTKLTMTVPSSITSTTMTALTRSLAAYKSLHEINLSWDYTNTLKKDVFALSLRNAFLTPIYELSELHCITINGFIFHWNDTLCLDMASSWPYMTKLEVSQRGHGPFTDVRDLAHFAEECPYLESLEIPFECRLRDPSSIDSCYEGRIRDPAITIWDCGVRSDNNLITALYLYTLFGVFTFYDIDDDAVDGIGAAAQYLWKYLVEGDSIAKGSLDFRRWNKWS